MGWKGWTSAQVRSVRYACYGRVLTRHPDFCRPALPSASSRTRSPPSSSTSRRPWRRRPCDLVVLPTRCIERGQRPPNVAAPACSLRRFTLSIRYRRLHPRSQRAPSSCAVVPARTSLAIASFRFAMNHLGRVWNASNGGSEVGSCPLRQSTSRSPPCPLADPALFPSSPSAPPSCPASS